MSIRNKILTDILTSITGGAVNSSNLQNIYSASDIPDTLDNSKIYIINGFIDLTGTGKVFNAPNGANFKGYGTDVSGIICSDDDYTLMGGNITGNIFASSMTFTISGANSKIYDLTSTDGDSVLEVDRVNYTNCTARGELTGFRQGLETNVGLYGGSPSLTHSGVSSGWRTDVTNAFGLASGAVIHKAGTNCVFNDRFITEINCDLPAIGALIDFSESNIANDESLQIRGARIKRAGVLIANDTAATPNITERSIKSRWKNNVGIANTHKYIKSSCTAEVETVISATDEYYPLLGTFTVDNSSHLEMNPNGVFTMLTGSGVTSFTSNLVLSGTQGNTIDVRIVKSTDDFVTFDVIDHAFSKVENFSGPNDVARFIINFDDVLTAGEKFRIEVENKTSTNNVTMLLGSSIAVREFS